MELMWFWLQIPKVTEVCAHTHTGTHTGTHTKSQYYCMNKNKNQSIPTNLKKNPINQLNKTKNNNKK